MRHLIQISAALCCAAGIAMPAFGHQAGNNISTELKDIKP
jgi:hypothetical protein